MVDLNKLSEKEFVELMNALSNKVKRNIDRTIKYLNDILGQYGLEMFIVAKIVNKNDIINLNKEQVTDFLFGNSQAKNKKIKTK